MTYDPKITKEMGEMDFTETTAQCVNRVRAMSPWPCGYVTTETGARRAGQRPAWHGAARRSEKGPDRGHWGWSR